jgi:uncharacterized repeat protein (TIGR01451 family)
MVHRVSYFLTLAFIESYAVAQFSPPRAITIESLATANSLTQGDIDGDGDTDILAAGSSRGIVLLVNSDGSGNFNSFPVADINFNVQARSVHMVDMDVDGNVDVVVQGTGLWWARSLGGYSFSPMVPVPNTVINHYSVNFDDNDDDGDQDLFVLLPGTRVKLYRIENLGAEQFGSVQLIAEMANLSSSTAFRSYAFLLDANGDEDNDIAVVQQTSNADIVLELFLQGPGGAYIAQSPFMLPNCNDGVMALTNRVRTWDQDSDGLDDLIIHACGGLLEWRRSNGDGSYAEPLPLVSFTTAPISVAPLDIDPDGIPDMIALSENGLETAFGLGDNVYAAPSYPVNFEPQADPRQLIATDVSGDGRPELFVVLQGFERVQKYVMDVQGVVQIAAVLTDYVPNYFEHMRAADLTGDGLPDLLRTAHLEGMVLAYANLGPEGFRSPQIVIESDTNVFQIEVCDMNSDGSPDIVLFDDSLHIYIHLGGLVFQKSFSFLPAGVSYADEFKCADLDADGDVDLLFTVQSGIRRFRNNGNNTFTVLGTTPALSWFLRPRLLGFMDVDEDGDQDVLATYDGSGLEWVRNDGGLEFGSRTLLPGIGYPDYVEGVDMDGDGREDIFSVQNYSSNEARASWLRNLGSAVFSPAVEVVSANAHGQCSPRPMDVDNDGDLDVVIALAEGGVFMENQGLLGFGPEQPLATMPWNAIFTTHDRAWDLDADGDRDLVFYTSIGGLGTGLNGVAWVENFGADPYQLSGSVFADLDGDGSRDPEEPALPGASIVSDPDGYIALNDALGLYTVHCQAGQYTVSAFAPSPLWALTTTPGSYSVEPTASQPEIGDLDFGFAPTEDVSSLSLELVLSGGACSDTTSLWITIVNDGTRIEPGVISLALDPAFAFVSSVPEPVSVMGNSITWNFDPISFGELYVLQASVIIPSADLLGSTYANAVVVNTLDDVGAVTGTFEAVGTDVLACSFDPNDKQVALAGYGPSGAVPLVQEHVEYTVRFQNTGNAPAVDLMIRDHLSTSLDPTSLELLGASHHPTAVSIDPSGELVVRFEGIQLPDSGSSFTGSQGFIRFRLAILPGEPHLTQISNTAEIYFDLNEEVVTNTVLNTLVDCDLWTPEITVLEDGVLEATEGDAYQWYLDEEPIEGAVQRTLMFDDQGAYSVFVLSEYGCEATTDPVISAGIETNSKDGLRISIEPNPFNSDTRLFLSEPIGLEDRIEFIDLTGRIVHHLVGQGKVIAIGRGDLRSGLYLLRIVNGTHTMAVVRILVD